MSNLLRYLEMDSLRNAIAYARGNRQRFEGELAAFVRFASVSAQPRCADDIAKCAAWLAGHLRTVGLDKVQVVPTARHPIVYADCRHAAPGTPTVLIYGHYVSSLPNRSRNGARHPSIPLSAETTSMGEARATTRDKCLSTSKRLSRS